MGKKLTLQQYNTLKALHANNPQGKSFEEYLEAVCLLKELEYDPSIHEEVDEKVPLQAHITRSKAGLAESGKSTHKHEYKRVETPVEVNHQMMKIITIVCKCGSKIAIDLKWGNYEN